ncbi:MAG: hypothetical protein E7249_02045 [Paenibacillaceae bacterium]|nr:hypothetical protein [Paenibacillaceae bacterium]
MYKGNANDLDTLINEEYTDKVITNSYNYSSTGVPENSSGYVITYYRTPASVLQNLYTFTGNCYTRRRDINTTPTWVKLPSNEDLENKLSTNAFYITNIKTLADLYSAYASGIIFVYNSTGNVPSYGSGIILRCSNSNFKLLLVDDDTDAMYLWSLTGAAGTALIISANKTKVI